MNEHGTDWTRRPASWGDERGSVTAWFVIVVAAAIFGFGGLVYDGGRAVNRQAEIIDVAWVLANTASAEATLGSGGSYLINEPAARTAVAAAAQQWPDLRWDLTVSADEATVTVYGTYQTKLLHHFGVSGWDYEGTRTAVAGKQQ